MGLTDKACKMIRKGDPALDAAAVKTLLAQVSQWSVVENGKALQREFTSFATYADGARFLAAVAALADAQDHHPDLALGYKKLGVAWSTHSVGGLSENDFICAAKVDALWAARSA